MIFDKHILAEEFSNHFINIGNK